MKQSKFIVSLVFLGLFSACATTYTRPICEDSPKDHPLLPGQFLIVGKKNEGSMVTITKKAPGEYFTLIQETRLNAQGQIETTLEKQDQELLLTSCQVGNKFYLEATSADEQRPYLLSMEKEAQTPHSHFTLWKADEKRLKQTQIPYQRSGATSDMKHDFIIDNHQISNQEFLSIMRPSIKFETVRLK